MQCDKCRHEAILFQPSSGRHLCGRHLSADIEVRAKRAIRAHRWMRPGDHIAVELSGDKKSAALALFLKKLVAGRHDIRLSAIPAGDGQTDGGCPPAARKVAGLLGIPLVDMPGGDGAAAQDRPTKIALAFTLDDIAREVLVQFLSGTVEKLVHPGRTVRGGIPVICPFITVPSEELDLSWDGQEIGFDLASGPPLQNPLSREAESLLRDYHNRHPATRFALMNLAEELSGGGVAEIAAAALGRNGPGTQGISEEVYDDGA
jgi:hypothetical protein